MSLNLMSALYQSVYFAHFINKTKSLQKQKKKKKKTKKMKKTSTTSDVCPFDLHSSAHWDPLADFLADDQSVRPFGHLLLRHPFVHML